VKLRKRLLIGSLAMAVAAVVVVAVATSNSGSNGDTSSTDSVIKIDKDHQLDQPTLNTNAALAGTALPRVNVRTDGGHSFPTGDLVGRPLVINYWSSTCLPCKKELPDFVTAHDKYGDSVRFVGIDAYAPSTAEVQFAKDRGVDYELFYDGDGRFATAAGLSTQPVTLFVSANGTIVEQTGQIDLATIERNVQALLS
jgi:thiol-disulfide isomerase/thioredoxin